MDPNQNPMGTPSSNNTPANSMPPQPNSVPAQPNNQPSVDGFWPQQQSQQPNQQQPQSYAQQQFQPQPQQVSQQTQQSPQQLQQQIQQQPDIYQQANPQVDSQPSGRSSKKKVFIAGIAGAAAAAVAAIVILVVALTAGVHSRTIMLYVAGSNLESQSGLATADLDSIKFNEVDPNTKVVLMAGGALNWDNNYVSPSETSIFELTQNGFTKVDKRDAQDMGKAETLQSFLDYTKEHYKTDAYDLIFWNHGGAIDGSEYDEKFANDNLTLSEIRSAFDNSKFNKKNSLELVIFRTCLNGTIEVADTLKDYARYMVASEEVTYGSPGSSTLNFINGLSIETQAPEIGKKFINSYKTQLAEIKERRQYSTAENSIYSTYSVVDLSKIDQLEKSMNDFFGSLNLSSSYNQVAKARGGMLQYASSQPAYDMVDLYNLIDKIKELDPDKADKILSNIEQAVVSNWATNDKSRGLSIYFPFSGDSGTKRKFLSVYSQIEGLQPYYKFINEFANNKRSSSYDSFATSANNDKAQTFANTAGQVSLSLELTDDQVKDFAYARYHVMRQRKQDDCNNCRGIGEWREDADQFYDIIYMNGAANLDGNKLTADVQKRIIQVSSKENPSSKHYLWLGEESSETDNDHTTASDGMIFLKRRDVLGISPAKMSFRLQNNNNNIEVSKFVVDTKNSDTKNTLGDTSLVLPNTTLVDTDKYETIQFLSGYGRKLIGEDGSFIPPDQAEEWKTMWGLELPLTETPQFSFTNFDDNTNYYGVFSIHDINGNQYYTKVINLKGDS